MNRKIIAVALFSLFFAVSCSNSGRIRDSAALDVEVDLPPEQKAPVLRILDYENMAENAALSPWLRRYLANGITGLESPETYRNSYLFISSIRAPRRAVIDHWMANYQPERDFPRLVAERIQKRLNHGLPGLPPDTVYGPNYEKTVREAYRYGFWGAERLDDTWVYALPVVEDEYEPPANPLFWGFILMSVPRETLEIQVLELLAGIEDTSTNGGRGSTREQNAIFDAVKAHFFNQF